MPKYDSLYRTGSVWSSILKLSIPALVIILLLTFYNMADMIFIGQLGDSAMVASVSIVSPLFSLLMAVATMIGFGACTLITNSFGANDLEQAKMISSVSFWAAILFSIVIIPILLVLRSPLLYLLGATSETFGYASEYFTILLLGAPFMILSTMLASIIRADGSIKESMIGNIAGTITNLVLDPVFILVLKQGVKGAAIATVAGNLLATLICLYFIFHNNSVSIRLSYAKRKPFIIGTVLALGLPNAVSTILSGFASSFSNNLLKGYGTDAIAAMAAAGKVSMIIGMIILGITMGTQPLLAYAYGAKDQKRLRELLKDLIVLTSVLGLSAAGLSYFARTSIIHLFLKTSSAASLAESVVLFLIIGAPFTGLVNIATNLMQAAQNAGGAIILSALRQGILLIAFLYLFESFFGFTGIAMAHTAADMLSFLIALGFIYRQLRKINEEILSVKKKVCIS
ncbi:MAG: MATE family efflux transporter [Eubacteriales bacterium]|nr:MATE family efflux transporter [Eubacteriales bacterium]